MLFFPAVRNECPRRVDIGAFMRKRFQKGNVRKVNGSWNGRYWKNGKRVSVTLGRISEMRSKSQGMEKLSEILRPLNASTHFLNPNRTFKDFVEQVYLPARRIKWKRSTAMTTEDRIRFHLIGNFANRRLSEITRAELQAFLNEKELTLALSVVKHLRWDLSRIFRFAVR